MIKWSMPSTPWSVNDFRIFLKHPLEAYSFFTGDKISAFSKISRKVAKQFSSTPEEIIVKCLKESVTTKTLVLPPRLSYIVHRRQDFGYCAIMSYYLCRILKPKIVVETGVLSGRSSLMILQALNDNNSGMLYSIDLGVKKYKYQISNNSKAKNESSLNDANKSRKPNPSEPNKDFEIELPMGQEIGWLVTKNLKKRWKLILGDARIELPRLLDDLGTIDIFIRDSDHSYDPMMFEFQTAWPYINSKGILCSDDISFNNSWFDFFKKIKGTRQVVIDGIYGLMPRKDSQILCDIE